MLRFIETLARVVTVLFKELKVNAGNDHNVMFYH